MRFKGLQDALGDEVVGGAEDVVQAPLVLPGQLEGLGDEVLAEFVARHDLGGPALQ